MQLIRMTQIRISYRGYLKEIFNEVMTELSMNEASTKEIFDKLGFDGYYIFQIIDSHSKIYVITVACSLNLKLCDNCELRELKFIWSSF